MTAPPTPTPPGSANPDASYGADRHSPALSPSRASDFKQCPLKYRLRAIDRIPEPPARYAVRGTVVHAVLESLYRLPSGERIPERAAALVAPAWERLLAERPEVGALVPDGPDAFLDEVRALVRGYYRLEDPTAFDPESCEALIEVALPDGSPLRGYVDRIDIAPGGRLRVVDYKTGRAPRLEGEGRALFQLKFYALIMLRARGVVPAQLRLLYLTDGQILTYTPDADELLRFERIVSALWAAISTAGRTGDFPPNPGWVCEFCDYKPLCPAYGGTPPPYPGWPASQA
ncbi:RecB family exonuclease [Nocardia sp. CDC159]|uniref:RecB family exonuclease n=1 Tax=Nocardia pulmonis TaxID=2951408 RepID=A0A9X2IZ11_9NOCA|nr:MULTISPECIES: RecB family exonuclease [Nocardia]MCM6775525.1 RecB family exonuclease [Nocardia pulmonis]MCM6787741.1 RecB family exonuclease [Nocardia sp. CDC159]